MSEIRNKFIEDARKELGYTPGEGELWAAKWMAEFINKHFQEKSKECGDEIWPDELEIGILQLIKELE